MTPQTTLDAVRELSERATLRPAPMRLRLKTPADPRPEPRSTIIAYEDLHTPRIGSWTRPHQSGKRQAPREHVTRPAMEKDFMRAALDKAAAALERRIVVIPAGQF